MINSFPMPYVRPSDHIWEDLAPVVVAGAGPVGLALAAGLARRGIPVIVVDAKTAVSQGSRAICTSRHSLEILDHLGVGDRTEERGLAWATGRTFFRDRQVLRFNMPSEDWYVRAPMVNISQPDIEQYLYETLVDNELVTFLMGSEITGVHRATDGQGRHNSGEIVTLDVDTPDGPRTLRSSWVVAADGARSAVRKGLGLRLNGNSYEGRYLIADITWESPWEHERFVWFDPDSDPGSTIIMHAQPDNVWRFDCQIRPEDDAEELLQPDRLRERIARHLTWLGIEDEGQWEILWSSVYNARALALDEFRHGSVLFAGDAAHLVPIFGVRGMNSGLEDASTLMWQLPAVITGHADEKLLDVYAAERRYGWEQNISNAELSTLFMTPETYGYQATRRAILPLIESNPELRHLVDPRQSAATHSFGSPINFTDVADAGVPSSRALRPGQPVSDITVDEKGGTLLGLGGSGFIVLASQTPDPFAGKLADALAAAFPAEGATVVTPSQTALELLGINPGSTVVLRPEGLVLAVLDGKGDDLIDSVIRQVATPASTAIQDCDRQLREPDPEAANAETVWEALSSALDARESDSSRTDLLVKVIMLQAMESQNPDRITDFINRAHSLTEARL